MKALKLPEELLRYPNHPLKSACLQCRKCKGYNVMAPSYPGDWFDCWDCGHSMPPTKKQIQAMKNRKT